jgi:protein MpaA
LTALLAAVALAVAGGSGLDVTAGSVAPVGPVGKLVAAVAPRAPMGGRAEVVLGHSANGRPITATAMNGVGTMVSGGDGDRGGPVILVFGCIHGDECAGTRAVEKSWRGCPPYGGGLVTVDNLDPDGLALGTRLNANGVDLNRNFAYDWRPIGVPGDLEYSGTAPFSEPETRIARRLIRALHPDITVWFHQQADPLVRAWGPSIPVARTYARLAGDRFVPMPWMDGTAPNWQNHAFPGTASFVVELPSTGPVRADRHGQAIFELAGALMGVRTLLAGH